MRVTKPNKHHTCWWFNKNWRIVRIDLNYTEGKDWKQWVGFHWINGGGIRLILSSGIMWELTN